MSKTKVQQELLFSQMETNLEALSPEALRDMARNDSANPLWRIAATELLLKKDHPYGNHPDLAELVWAIKNNKEYPVKPEKEESRDTKEKFPQTLSVQKEQDKKPGVFKSGVTTNNLLQD